MAQAMLWCHALALERDHRGSKGLNGKELRSAMKFQLKDEAKRLAAVEGLKTITACASEATRSRHISTAGEF
jgi:hypothetical protein